MSPFDFHIRTLYKNIEQCSVRDRKPFFKTVYLTTICYEVDISEVIVLFHKNGEKIIQLFKQKLLAVFLQN